MTDPARDEEGEVVEVYEGEPDDIDPSKDGAQDDLEDDDDPA